MLSLGIEGSNEAKSRGIVNKAEGDNEEGAHLAEAEAEQASKLVRAGVTQVLGSNGCLEAVHRMR